MIVERQKSRCLGSCVCG